MATKSQHDAEWHDADFDHLVQKLLSQHHVPGISIAVVEQGKVWTKSYGFARMPDIPASADTLYCVGSTTKAMLAACVGVAIRQEPLDNRPLQTLTEKRWSTPIKSILKEDFVLQDEYATNNITIEDALSHRTGLPGADQLYGDWMGQLPKQITKALRYLGPLNKPFRTTWQYNNLMYSAVADLLETVLGCRWGTALHRLIWAPLGMTSTYSDIDEVPLAQRERLAWGYHWVNSGCSSKYLREPFLSFAGIGPAGSVISSVNDFSKWMIALLEAARDDPSNINSQNRSTLPHDLFVELTTPRTLTSICLGGKHTNPLPYSLGWFHFATSAGAQHPIIAHAGGLTGFATQLYLLPNDGFGIAIMANTPSSGHRASEAICLEVIARFLKLSPEAKKTLLQEATLLLPAAEENSAAPDVEMTNGDVEDPKWDDFARQVRGTYTSPAYGTFQLAEFKQGQHGEAIMYNAQTPSDQRKKRDELRKRTRSLSFVPVGHRTWHNRLILRQRTPTGDKASERGKSTQFLDLEYFTLHGVDSSKPGQLGEIADDDIEKRASLDTWQSESWTGHGAAFQHRDNVTANGGSRAWSLGVRMGTAFVSENGSDADGWETEMVWFTKVG